MGRTRLPADAVFGFTLVEMLVVLGIVGLLSGVVGLALRPGSPSRSLESAQATVAALVSVARGHAAVSRLHTRLLIYSENAANLDEGRKLRFLRVVVDDPNSADWIAVGEGIALPTDVAIVPTSAPTTALGVTWGSGPISSLSGDTALTVVTANRRETNRYYYVEFTSIGTSVAASIILSPAAFQASDAAAFIAFTSPMDVRGIKLSQYGAVTLLPDVSAF